MNANWQPSASIENLRKRSELIQKIRNFFHSRGVLEVETPLMCHTSVTDPFIQSIPAIFQAHPDAHEQKYYLQTSPEYAMKRLLAANVGCIFQISKAFRQGEVGRHHNPEFTMMEWYRIGFDHHQLMDEMDELLQHVLNIPKAIRKTYADLFFDFLNINPHQATLSQLQQCALENNIKVEADIHDRDTWLNLIMSHVIEPKMDNGHAWFVYDFPASQAALARIVEGEPRVAARFEVYFRGMELANGFYELQDVHEQRKRFENNLIEREKLGLNLLPIDELFLAGLNAGLPDCSGVALGIDRLIMLALDCREIGEVLSFNFSRS